jgi:DNA-binding NarL/FixJ family response regulator
MAKIRVLLADNHHAFRERVSGLLGEDFEIVGTADNGREAVVTTQRLDPDVLVIDISMPVLDGLQARTKPQAPRTLDCAIYSGHGLDKIAHRALLRKVINH